MSNVISLIARCKSRSHFEELQSISMKNSKYYLENNLLRQDEEFRIQIVEHLPLEKYSNEEIQTVKDKMKIIHTKFVYFYSKLKATN